MAVTTKERPIIFNARDVRAIIDGTKAQARRVVTPQPSIVHAIHGDASITTNLIFRRVDQRIHCPFGRPGDRLWVRENVRIGDTTSDAWYMADGRCPNTRKYPYSRSAMYMPKWASRIMLEITEVRVQRLRDISEDDAQAEGFFSSDGAPDTCGMPTEMIVEARNEFMHSWDSTAKDGARWEDNPWVWAVSFKRVEA